MRKVIIRFTNDFDSRNDALWVRHVLTTNGYQDTILWEGVEYDLPRAEAYYLETEDGFTILELKVKHLTSAIPHISNKLKMEFFIPTKSYIDELHETIKLQDCVDCD